MLFKFQLCTPLALHINFHSKKEKQTTFTSQELVSPARRHNIFCRLGPPVAAVKQRSQLR